MNLLISIFAIHAFQYLGARDKSCLNGLNKAGESALHLACMKGRDKNVQALLQCGADPNHTGSTRYAIHCAMKVDNAK